MTVLLDRSGLQEVQRHAGTESAAREWMRTVADVLHENGFKLAADFLREHANPELRFVGVEVVKLVKHEVGEAVLQRWEREHVVEFKEPVSYTEAYPVLVSLRERIVRAGLRVQMVRKPEPAPEPTP